MSVINQMLQDLESRENRPEDRLGQLVKQLSARMPAKKATGQKSKIILLIILAMFLLVTVYLLINQQNSEQATQSLAVINAEKPVAQTETNAQAIKAKTIAANSEEPVEAYSELVAQPPVNDDIAIKEMQAEKQASVAETERKVGDEISTALPVMVKMANDDNKPVSEAGVNLARQSLAPKHVVYKKASRVSKEQQFVKLMTDARSAYRTRSYSLAIDLLNQALVLQINNVEANELLAASLSKVGQPNQAKTVLQRSVDNGVLSPSIASQLAIIFVSEQNNEEALQVLNTQVAQAKDNADYHALMAAVQQRLARHDEAIVSYLRALQLNRESSVWWMGMAISLEKSGSSPEALQAYKEAKKIGALSHGLVAYVDGKISQLNNAANESNE